LSLFGKSSGVTPLESNPDICVQGQTLMWSHQVIGLWIVFGSFCPQGNLQLGVKVTLPFPAAWSKLLLFSPGSSFIALYLQLCLVSFSLSKVGQFSFEYCPLCHETSSGIHHLHCFWKVGWSFHPYSQPLCLSWSLLCASSASLVVWLVAPLLLLVFLAFPMFIHWEFGT
jgi:hypothetical protein